MSEKFDAYIQKPKRKLQEQELVAQRNGWIGLNVVFAVAHEVPLADMEQAVEAEENRRRSGDSKNNQLAESFFRQIAAARKRQLMQQEMVFLLNTKHSSYEHPLV